MRNRAMEAKLERGEAYDVAAYPRTPGGHYLLDPGDLKPEELAPEARAFFGPRGHRGIGRTTVEDGDVDYCNAATEEWVWSIGYHRETKTIYASHDVYFYDQPGFDCLWLR